MAKLSIKDVGLVVGYCSRFRDEEEHIERGIGMKTAWQLSVLRAMECELHMDTTA